MEGRLKNLDGLKTRFSNEETKDKRKRQWSLALPAILNFIVGLAMLITGAVYQEDDKDGNATYFLMVGGGYLFSINLIKLVLYLIPMDWADKAADIAAPILDFGYFIIIIWGSVIVFGAYSTWDSDDTSSEFYCPAGPFEFAFGVLICFWILFPLMCCCGCCAACCAIAAKMSPTPQVEVNA